MHRSVASGLLQPTQSLPEGMASMQLVVLHRVAPSAAPSAPAQPHPSTFDCLALREWLASLLDAGPLPDFHTRPISFQGNIIAQPPDTDDRLGHPPCHFLY
eukprot:6182617-Pleurochrysis_carterae.AAC.4